MSQSLWLIPALPLLGAIINLVVGRRLPRALSQWLAVVMVGAAFGVSVSAFFNLIALAPEERLIHETVFNWIGVGGFSVDVAFWLDPLSAVMILVVTGVGTLIHIYAVGYMEHEQDYARFFTAMNLFVFAMLMLVLADNYLLMFLGWEGVGVCSYLLIGFWYNRDNLAVGTDEKFLSPRSSATKAFVVNRIGDFGFTLGVILMFWTFGSLAFEQVFPEAMKMSTNQGNFEPLVAGPPVITVITLLLFVGATGKSAQIPLFIWLPDAMAGPTPVSALIHAATMVTAGVYMVARSHVLYELAPTTMAVVAVLGVLTAFIAATIALVQNDLKRVLAYSTVSQLGYMFFALGVGAFGAGIFHLMTHAFFKALLFLSAGAVMHAMNDMLDMRRLGGLRKIMPITFWVFLIGALALAGVPMFSGFFSKDEILTAGFAQGQIGLWLVGVLTALMTAFYIFRAVFLTFGGAPRWKPGEVVTADDTHAAHGGAEHGHGALGLHPRETKAVMWLPLVILAILSVGGGYVGLPSVIGPNQFGQFLAPVLGEHALEISAELEWTLIAISVVAAFAGILVALWFYVWNKEIPARLGRDYPWLYAVFANKYWVDPIYDYMIARPGRWLANVFWVDVDGRIINGFADGLGNVFRNIGRGLRSLQTGYARGYALAMLIGIVIVIAVVVMRF
ncbi:MAG: NADH-quinone oxidoreductase subunit L [Chloroflexi bacterium]|nr:NADH-quinone oxidoreductase subunit L [Chloroflexota bacterium]